MTPEKASLPPHCRPTTRSDAGQVTRWRRVEPLDALLGHAHDRGDDVAEAAMLFVLEAHDVRLFREDGQLAGREHAQGLQFFAAEADDQRIAAEVGVEAQVAEGADGDLRAGCVDGDAAAVVVRDGDDVVDVGVARENLRLDAADGVVHGGGDALDGGVDAEDIFGADGAVVVAIALEGVALKRRLRLGCCGGELQSVEVGRLGQDDQSFMHPTALRRWGWRRSR